ncbi:MAG: hypothetical protein KGL39_41030 [Patescibacteria group bacterium]|nr:hypothetical protein [Patescibacteria group bacterium]
MEMAYLLKLLKEDRRAMRRKGKPQSYLTVEGERVTLSVAEQVAMFDVAIAKVERAIATRWKRRAA